MTRLHDYAGTGVHSHDPQGHLATIIDVIETVGLAGAGVVVNHPNGPHAGLISPINPPYQPFAAQWAGGDRSAWDRGSPGHLRRTAQHLLSGSKRVDVTEQVGTFQVSVAVYAAEVSEGDVDLIARALDRVAPAGTKVSLVVRPGWSFGDLAQSGLTFEETSRLSCRQVKAIVPGTPRTLIEELMTL